MRNFDKRVNHFITEVRRSWTISLLILAFILILWTCQLALIITFQVFWPVPPRIIKNNDFIIQGDINYGNSIPARFSISKGKQSNEGIPDYKVVCYFVTQDISNSVLGEADLGWCTHINVGFALVSWNSTLYVNPSEALIYEAVVRLKKLNPKLKVLVSVQDNKGSFAVAVSSDINRKRLANSMLDFIVKYKLDGIDLDWEWPSWPTPNPRQRQNFTQLLATLRAESTLKDIPMILTAAVGSPAAIIIQCYDIGDMARYVDFINLMSYDYHMYSKVTPVTGPNAPLYSRPDESTYAASLNTNWSAANWEFYGMPKKKIIIGVPTYGHSFTLLNENNNRWGAPASGNGAIGQGGFTSHADACLFMSRPTAVTVFDNYYRVPYSYDRFEWISHETLQSIVYKAEFIKKYGYGGGMIFSLNVDDYNNSCGTGKFPLSRKFSSTLLED